MPPSRPQQQHEPQQTSLQQQHLLMQEQHSLMQQQQSLMQQQHSLIQQQHSLIQQQHSLIQQQQYNRTSAMMLVSNQHLNAMGHNSNVQQQLGNHMLNKPSALQLQLFQQQQQQQQLQQQQQIQRNLMMGIGNANIGNLGNNGMVGIQGLGNAMGIGSGHVGISTAIGGAMGNNSIGQNPMNISQASNISNAITQQLRSEALTPPQAALMATKFGTNMLGGPVQSGGIGGLSMLAPTLNHATNNINPTQMQLQQQQMQILMQLQQQQMQMQQQQQQQRETSLLQPVLSPPQQLVVSPSIGMTQQQQQASPHQETKSQQQMQMQQQQQQQQETTSLLQPVLSPPQQQVGSPSIGMTQQQQQASQQRTPMSPQISSGGMHPPPASPQLSSQTMGSVGSITNSPMDLQGGVDKSA